jgi:hypothetical protein
MFKYRIKNYSLNFVPQYIPEQPGKYQCYCDLWKEKYLPNQLEDAAIPFELHQYSLNNRLNCPCFAYNDRLKRAHKRTQKVIEEQLKRLTGTTEVSQPTKRRRDQDASTTTTAATPTSPQLN